MMDSKMKLIAAFVASMALMMSSCMAQVATVALTFDVYTTTYYTAYPLMSARGLVGTWYVNPGSVGPAITADNLLELQANGWEIGIYSNVPMPPKLASDGRVATKQWMTSAKSNLFATTGITANTYAASGRQWNPAMAELSRDVFGSVRVASGMTWQPYPLPDRNYIENGGTSSLGPADTAQGLCAQLDSLIAAAAPSVWYVVTHEVLNDPNDLYSVSPTAFSGFLDCVAARRSEGKIRVVTVSQSLTSPLSDKGSN